MVCARILEAAMQTRMGRVRRGLTHLDYGCFYLLSLSCEAGFMDLQPAFNW